MRRRGRPAAVLASLVVLVLALGMAVVLVPPLRSSAEGPSGPEMAAASALAVERAGAVAVRIVSASDPAYVLLQSGDEATGFITVDSLSTELTRAGGRTYVKGTAQYWTQFGGLSAEAAEGVARQWVRVPLAAENELAEGLDSLLFSTFVRELRSPTAGPWRDRVEEAEAFGRPAYKLTGVDGTELYIAREGEPLPLRLVEPGNEADVLRFNEFGRRQRIEAPAVALGLPNG